MNDNMIIAPSYPSLTIEMIGGQKYVATNHLVDILKEHVILVATQTSHPGRGAVPTENLRGQRVASMQLIKAVEDATARTQQKTHVPFKVA